jgi:phage/plasmid-like protein (TIGR03299 family)
MPIEHSMLDSGLFVNKDGHQEWHKLGNVVLEPPKTMGEAMVAASMDWEVLEFPIGPKPRVVSNTGETQQLVDRYGDPIEDIDGWKSLHRSDTGALLHVCKNSYTVLQNKDAFAWFDPFIQDGDATISAAVSLSGGQRIAITVKLNDPVDVVPGDPLEPYILLFNSHAGNLAAGVKPTTIRTVCHNTLSLNLRGLKGKIEGTVDIKEKSARVRHSAGIHANMEMVRDLLDIQKRIFNTNVDEYRLMAHRDLTAKEFQAYVSKVFEVVETEEKSVVNTRRWEPIVTSFESGLGADIPGNKGTLWTALNAITDWTSHQRGGDIQDVEAARRRLNSIWFEDGDAVNARAHKVALELLKV